MTPGWVRRAAARLAAIDRGTWLTTAGAGVLAACAFLPWSEVPSSSRSAVNPSGELLFRVDLHWTEALARLAAFLGGLFFLWAAWSPAPGPRARTLPVAWTLAAFLLCYPCWHQQWAPDQEFDKRLLFREMARVVKDMEENLPQEQVDWRDWQQFSPRTTRKNPVLFGRAPGENPSLLAPQPWDNAPETVPARELPGYVAAQAPQQWDNALETVLGLSQEYLAFFKPLILAALLNALASVLLGVHLLNGRRGGTVPGGTPPDGRRGGGVARLRRGLAWCSVASLLFLAAPLVPRFVGEYLLHEGELALSRGEQQDSLEYFRAAPSWKPALGRSWAYCRELGRVTRLQDRQTPAEPYLADGYDALAAADPESALKALRRAQAYEPGHRALPPALGLTLSEAGIAAFNRGQYGLAKEHWEASLAYLPTNPTAWYGLSLVHLRWRNFDRATRCARQVVRLQQWVGYKRTIVRSYSFLTESWEAFHRGDLRRAHELYALARSPEKW